MRRDAVLPSNAVQDAVVLTGADETLVTGATGFLGRYLVRELLQRPGGGIHCLVRAASESEARTRLRDVLRTIGVDLDAHHGRLSAHAGATDAPHLGLDKQNYLDLARRVGTIYHCAAEVNWAVGYERLRASNVLGTLGVIRFASEGGLKRIYFSSSLAVCFTINGPQTVDEDTDMLPFLQDMPLAYAQSKCVAENLLRTAAARGVPVSLVRPTLISGDSVTGECNSGDLISALLQGCVKAGAAIDRDWRLDCVPVDHVARVLARLGTSERPGWEVLHLVNQPGRHWREVVLWMNLYGYSVELMPHADWLKRAFARASTPGGLFSYRSLFGAGKRAAGRPPYETYLEDVQGRLRNEQSRDVLTALDITAPPLTSELFQKYIAHYVSVGLLPPVRRNSANPGVRDTADHILRAAIEVPLANRGVRLLDIAEQPFAAANGIFNEICSARLGGLIGIRRFDVRVSDPDSTQHTLAVVLKSKPSDTQMQDLLVEVATLCDPKLGTLCRAFQNELGLSGCHERELALYETPEPRIRAAMPTTLGTHRDPDRGIWSVAMAYRPEAANVDVAATAGSWQLPQIDTILSQLAQVHAVWYRQNRQLSRLPWLPPPIKTGRMMEMAPFWLALAEYSSRYFDAWTDEPLLPLQRALVASLGTWWPALRALPQTLVHNDFNPRNFTLSRNPDGPVSLCVFDWELAGIDVPQHDLAELLCFVLPTGCSTATVGHFLETHRLALQQATGVRVDRQLWLIGFRLSLSYLLINRLPLYTLMHRFQPQAFLPRVMRNWELLYAMSLDSALEGTPNADPKAAQDNDDGHGE
jgi:thioester reductase-like protein